MELRDSSHIRSLPARLTSRSQRSETKRFQGSFPAQIRPEYQTAPEYAPYLGRRPFASYGRYDQNYGFNKVKPSGPGRRQSYDYGPHRNVDFNHVSSDSDVSDAVSANSFTFDGTEVDASETRTENELKARNLGSRLVATSSTGRKTEKPSPYHASSLTVLSSRFIDDAVLHGEYYAADLSVIAPVNPFESRKQPLFRWMYVVALLQHPLTNASRHLQGEPNFSSLIVSFSPSTVEGQGMSDKV